jgi:hypothetical protein
VDIKKMQKKPGISELLGIGIGFQMGCQILEKLKKSSWALVAALRLLLCCSSSSL